MILINPPAEKLGEENAILWGRGRQHHVREFAGPLSIKTVRRGEAEWRTPDARYQLHPRQFVLLNDQQPYTITVESKTPVETFCIFFERGFVEGVREFPERIQLATPEIAVTLAEMHRRLTAREAEPVWLEAQFVRLANQAAASIRIARQERDRLPALKTATRDELHRRLQHGRALIEDCWQAPLTLKEMAAAACLSPFHFHRLFTTAFQETPHHYLVRRRLEHAAHLLRATDLPVSLICVECGFLSMGSFSSLFSRWFGVSPARYRGSQLVPLYSESYYPG